MDLGLKGKRAVVTGGSRGIGRAIVETLAAEGAVVSFCARGQDGIDEVARTVTSTGGHAVGAAVDARNGDAVRAWVDGAAQSMGGIDIVVSNVSTRPDAQGEARWLQAFEADLMQHVRLAETALPHLKNGRDPSVVFIASVAATMTQLLPEEVAYGALKAGLVNFTGHLAERNGRDGIRANAISPGPVYFDGGAWDLYRQHKPKLYEMVLRLSALGRLGAPRDIANAVAFLASPAASYITGANLRVDGGTIKSTNF